MQKGLGVKIAGFLAGFALLAGCDMPAPPGAGGPATAPRPVDAGQAPGKTAPSGESLALAAYYGKLQADLLSQGLLRTDGGGRDAPFGARDLARNFEQITFFDEYERGAGLRASSGRPVPLRRWTQPVRVNVEFGPSVPEDRQRADRGAVSAFAARLSDASGHPVVMDAARANMHVLIYSEDDRAFLPQRARELAPGISQGALSVFRNLPRQIHCFVMAFSGNGPQMHTYTRAIIVIRAEHPDLLRDSCVHEEMAQGMGLANDSPRARPSIFNDDDEFAHLTRHDALLLKMLYDPRLSPGITLDQARPIIAQMAEELMGGPS